MLYISHLSFHTERQDEEPWHGYFTCVVDAPGIESALDKTRDLIRRLKDEEDVLEDIDAVYLESCVEVKSVPDGGFMASFQEWDGEVQGSIVTSVRGTSGDNAVAFGWVADETEGEEEASEGAESDADVEEALVADRGSESFGVGDSASGDSNGPSDDFDEPFMTF